MQKMNESISCQPDNICLPIFSNNGANKTNGVLVKTEVKAEPGSVDSAAEHKHNKNDGGGGGGTPLISSNAIDSTEKKKRRKRRILL